MKEETMSSNCRFTLDESLSLATVMVSRSSRSALSEEAGRSTPMRRALALLRTRRERPGRRAAEQRDERAARHSITSSARATRREKLFRHP
jgi:hypothetical protein